MQALAHMPTATRQGDLEAAFRACYEAHRERVYRLSLRYAGGEQGFAEDLTHDVFVKLLENLPHLDDHEDLGGWLYRVTANLAVSRLRRARVFASRIVRGLADNDDAPAVDERFELQESAARALEALRAMPARERVVICMKVLDGMSQKEIALALSLSEGYVSKLCARAWLRVRKAGWEVDDGDA